MDKSQVAAEGFSRTVAGAYQGWRYEDLPGDVTRTVKSFILDTTGAIAAAAGAPGIGELNGRLSSWEGQGPSTALIGKWKASPPTAALANGAAAHAAEFDDFHDAGRVHAYCVILPAVLAAAEGRGGVSGRDFIAAMATGVEFHARLGLTCYDSLGRGWHPSTSLGTMAAAMAAGRILELDAGAMLDALGIAFHQTSGTRQSIADGVLAKRLGPGFAARSGVLAAFLAADGLTGPNHCLEGEAGFFRLYEQNEVLPDLLLKDIGQSWEVLNFSMKPYPCCRCTHNIIEMGEELNADGIGPDEIEHIELYLGRTNWQIVGQTPYDVTKDSIVHAQFNAPYCLARSVIDGRVDLNSFQRPGITDPVVAGLAEKVSVSIDENYAETALEPARLTAKLTDGRTITLERLSMKGSPNKPMTEDEVLAKFADCLAFGMDASKEAVDALADVILNFEAAEDAAVLADTFPGKP